MLKLEGGVITMSLTLSNLDFSIIIVTYNSSKFIGKCLNSILSTIKSTTYSFEVIVVDNASQDETITILRQFPEVKVIENNENYGFSKANNIAVQNSNGNILFFINPDTVLQSTEVFRATYELFSTYEKIGAVGIKLLDENAKSFLSGFSFEPWWSAFFSLVTLGFVDLRIVKDKKFLIKAQDSNHPIEVDWVSGGAMFVKREVFMEVSGFDEKFFLYSEDVDICKRIKDKGYRILYLPFIEALHFGSHSSKHLDNRIFVRNKALLLYASKHYNKWQYLLYKVGILVNMIEKFILTITFGFLIYRKRDMGVRINNYLKVINFLVKNWRE